MQPHASAHQSQWAGESGTGKEASFSGLLWARMRYSALRGAFTTCMSRGCEGYGGWQQHGGSGGGGSRRRRRADGSHWAAVYMHGHMPGACLLALSAALLLASALGRHIELGGGCSWAWSVARYTGASKVALIVRSKCTAAPEALQSTCMDAEWTGPRGGPPGPPRRYSVLAVCPGHPASAPRWTPPRQVALAGAGGTCSAPRWSRHDGGSASSGVRPPQAAQARSTRECCVSLRQSALVAPAGCLARLPAIPTQDRRGATPPACSRCCAAACR